MKTPPLLARVSGLATLLAMINLLPTFNPQPVLGQTPSPDDFNPGANGDVCCLAVQPNGKVLAGGRFTVLGGQARNYIGRLNADGVLDTTFNPGANGLVNCLAVQADGKVLVGGSFTTLGEQERTNIGRLNADGTLDSTFNPRASGLVNCLAIQADGKVLVGGSFTRLAEQERTNIGRLNADGTADNTFSTGANAWVGCLAVQADGKVIVGGAFTTLCGQARDGIGRLNADGTLDGAFNPGAGGIVYSLAVQADGKILVGILFFTPDGQPKSRISRLSADGMLDSRFNLEASGWVHSLALQADGKVLVGGRFTMLGGQTCNSIGRLNTDGTLDSTFNPGASGMVYSLTLQADGEVLMGGCFIALDGQARNSIARLSNTRPATQSLSYDGSTLTWRRGGASPEVWRTTFEFSTNGTDWTLLGEGSRLTATPHDPSPGWELLHAAATPSITVRARGFTTGGEYNGSASVIEAYAGPPVLLTQPVSRTNAPGTVADFSVYAGGGGTLGYQWQLNGSNLPGATVESYAVTNVQPFQAGDYRVVVSNCYCSVTSTVAHLTVMEPSDFAIALNPPYLFWTTGGDAPWTAQTTYTHDGVLAAQSGPITHSQGSWLETTVTGPGVLSFWWKVSSQAYCDYLEFYSDMVGVSRISGEVAWRKEVFPIQSGLHVLRWCYTKDTAGSEALDHGWLDEVSFKSPPTTGPLLLIDLPTNQVRNLGETASFPVTAAGAMPLNYQWRKQGIPLLDETASALTLKNIQGSDAGLYEVVVTNYFGSVTSAPVELSVNLASDDYAFHRNSAGYVTALDSVYAVAIQADGKILIAGNGQDHFSHGDGVGRLNADGTPDSTFHSPNADSGALCLAVQEDGKVLVGGGFTRLCGQTRNYIGRLKVDGSLDLEFDPSADEFVFSIAVQPDGKLLVGGQFTTLGGQMRSHIGRLNVEGRVDQEFDPSTDAAVRCLAIQPDGKILVGGDFNVVAETARYRIARLNADGTVDDTFLPPFGWFECDVVYAIALQADGKILVGGTFNAMDGQPRKSLARINADGTLDHTFVADVEGTVAGSPPSVWTIALQADGKILVGGHFKTFGGYPRWSLGRLHPNGTVDSNFNLGLYANFNAYDVEIQADGQVLVGDYRRYTVAYGLQGPPVICSRHAATAAATQSLDHDGATITWLRGGSSPEIWRSTFEVSTNGSAWTPIGEGARVAAQGGGQEGGWELRNASLPANASLRARGWIQGAHSAWFLETYGGHPFLRNYPVSQTNTIGGSVTFTVSAEGSGPLGYQWYNGGTPLTDAGHVSGAQTNVLILTDVSGVDMGQYSVVVSNAYGSVTSAPAILNVRDPVILTQPLSQDRFAGESVAFTVIVAGTAPMGYQWRKGGIALAGATNSTLALAAAQAVDAGSYDVVVTNTYGSVTSAPCMLWVNLVTVETNFNSGANSIVYALAVQADGKILVGGDFTTLGGQPRYRIGQLNADGIADSAFDQGADDSVYALAVQEDGKVLAAGNFTWLSERAYRIGRLNGNGTADRTFNLGVDFYVLSLALQADGKVLAGGVFTTLGGQTRNHIGRLNADGTVDSTFDPGANSYVYALAVQADGKVLVGGLFTTLGGKPRNFIGRLNEDGTVDSTFTAEADGWVQCLALQADGKVLVGGAFGTLSGQPRSCIGRLNKDGTIDSTFNSGADDWVECLALQVDGKVLVGGRFTTLGGRPRNFIGRLNEDGTVDNTFNPGANYWVLSLATQADGKVLVGGRFTTLGGHARSYLARLNNNVPATHSMSYDGRNVVWLRGGSSPEVWRTTFEVTTNGVDWLGLGAGERIAGGWRRTAPGLSPNATVRARGQVTGGWRNNSSWFVESTLHVLPSLPLMIEVADGKFGVISNAFGFNISGATGRLVVVEGSTNLLEWWPLEMNTLGDQPWYFTDKDGPLRSLRFYRVRQQP
ncbi:MAG TPA: hypothetical protein VI136_13225 [Verrucomicrobiae bacterium]